MKIRRNVLLALIATSVAYLVLLAYPQPLFAYQLSAAGITVHSRQPIPETMESILERARARLDRSPLRAATRDVHVFICDSPTLFALVARQNYRVGGIADWLVGQHVFLRSSDMHNDRLIGPSGQPVPADRPLSYFIAHEVMHVANVRTMGRWRYARTAQWLDDGYADYIARAIDFRDALQKMKENARELDPRRSGLYIRYQLMVAYLLEKRGIPLEELLANPPPPDEVESQLTGLATW